MYRNAEQYEPTISLWEERPVQKLMLKNRRTGETYAIDFRYSCVIGRRAEDCDFRITTDDRYISGRHLRLIRDGTEVYVEDMKTKNGTWLNGKQLISKKRIHHGDILKIGKSEYEVV
ncbi:MAG: FHA domain-containing protein [Lachnospiraceae bacterium]|nr:FHA domain-containing protein [Lachnospiraceae bacterium]